MVPEPGRSWNMARPLLSCPLVEKRTVASLSSQLLAAMEKMQ